jgi:predicted ArsR family transcriptional regulator
MSMHMRDDDVAAIGLLDEPIRRRLYDWVVSRGEPVGRDEASRSLGITRSLAAFHLDRLTEAGLLDAGYRRLTGRSGPGAGRPARIYWRAQRELAVSLPARRYERVAELFAGALETLGGGVPPTPLLESASKLGEELGRGGDGRSAVARRLSRALEQAGYEPRPDDDGTIRLRNCPFDVLAERHRSLVCGTNLAMAEGIVKGAQAAQYRPVLEPQPGFCCVAFVRSPSVADAAD